MFDLTHKESIKKACKAITPVVDIMKLWGCQYFPLRGQRDRPKCHPEVGKSGLTNSGNLVELLIAAAQGDFIVAHVWEIVGGKISRFSEVATILDFIQWFP